MMRRAAEMLAVVVTLVAVAAGPAQAFDPNGTFQPGTLVWSIEAGYGNQENLEGHKHQTDLDIAYGGARLGYLPWGPVGSGPLTGALELGLEGIYQRYVHPVDAYYAGLAAVGRYHFLSLGRFVPYGEIGAAAGGTNLRAIEIDSDFAFLLFGGVGASVFITDNVALYGGWRIEHVSNGNIDQPNRGFEAHTGVVGISFFLK